MASVAKQLAAGRVYYQDEELAEDEEEDNDDDSETAAAEEGGASPKTRSPPPQQQGGGKILVMSLLEGSKNRRQRAWALAEPPHVIIGNPLALSGLVEHRGVRYHQVSRVVYDDDDIHMCDLSGMLC